MDTKEHYYSDDPTKKHIDAKTTLDGGRYYFLGNGYIQAAVQICSGNEGSPMGLLIMNPESFGAKSDALTFDPENGLAATMLEIRIGEQRYSATAETLSAEWSDLQDIPLVKINWHHDAISVEERLFCPDRRSGRLIRQISVYNLADTEAVLHFHTGFRTFELETADKVKTSKSLTLEYELSPLKHNLKLRKLPNTNGLVSDKAITYWRQTANTEISAPLDHLFRASKNQIASNISHQGIMDASIWQYNLEWVRDSANIAMGLTMSGHHQSARALLQRMLKHNVTDKGDAVDSGKVRPLQETELDQNGKLLMALKTYIDWTGDTELVTRYWKKIKALAEFPFQEELMHKSGLLHNQREFWERHSAYGVEDGFELCYQVFVAVGLTCAADFARINGEEELAREWEKKAKTLKDAVLSDRTFSMIENGHLIKRRDLQGNQQKTINPDAKQVIPESVPIMRDGEHSLDPDSSSALPIAIEFMDPTSSPAQKTLDEMEKLWNMEWSFGGYSRYNVTSEPDSAAPWPLASVFIAQANLEAGNEERVWRVLDWLHTVPGALSGSWYEIYGNRPVPPYAQIGIIPWAWAEIIKFFIHHLFGIRPSRKELVIRPRLLKGLQRAGCRVHIHGITLSLTLERSDKKQKGYSIDGTFTKTTDPFLKTEMPKKNTKIVFFL
ncbi:hypothetical protein GF407_17285 [candidate division KSB1 bacterium]|nr:hypothetical protein [candidate division KSB1 bacterium]